MPLPGFMRYRISRMHLLLLCSIFHFFTCMPVIFTLDSTSPHLAVSLPLLTHPLELRFQLLDVSTLIGFILHAVDSVSFPCLISICYSSSRSFCCGFSFLFFCAACGTETSRLFSLIQSLSSPARVWSSASRRTCGTGSDVSITSVL